jgi:DnaJ-like protein
MPSLDHYYRVLDLEPGTSASEVKRAWLDLTKVWHPDRFAGDPRMEAKAEEKLRAINDAYEQLCRALASSQRPSAEKTTAAPRAMAPDGVAVAPDSAVSREAGPSGERNRRYGVPLVALLLFILLAVVEVLAVSALVPAVRARHPGWPDARILGIATRQAGVGLFLATVVSGLAAIVAFISPPQLGIGLRDRVEHKTFWVLFWLSTVVLFVGGAAKAGLFAIFDGALAGAINGALAVGLVRLVRWLRA